MADIDEGFYVTSLIGMGVNQVTGDYSRGASGLLDREGKARLSRERGDDRRQPRGHVRHADARQRPRVPLRHQCADAARGGTDRCRTRRARASGGGGARGGRARARDLSQPAEAMDQGRVVAGLRGRHRRRQVAAPAPRRRVSGVRLAVGGDRRRSAPARGGPGLDRRSHRRHALLPRRARRLVRLGGAGRRRQAGARRDLCAGDR